MEEKEYIKTFLEAGSQNGCGDLSIMVGTIYQITSAARSAAYQKGWNKAIENEKGDIFQHGVISERQRILRIIEAKKPIMVTMGDWDQEQYTQALVDIAVDIKKGK